MSTVLKSAVLLCGISFVLGAFAGCKKDKKAEPEPTTGAELPSQPAPIVEPEPGAPVEQGCGLQTVYFAFDSSLLDAAARASIEESVRCYLDRNENVRILLTGACDPRGTEEYNIALGERRAQSVRSYMVSLGMRGNEISVRSVGEEFATGTDEASWALDRKVTPTTD